MEAVIARCGNRCDLCPLFKNNFSADQTEAINQGIRKYHHGGQGAEQRYSRACDGCLSDGHLAREQCAIRACTLEKRFRTCAQCPQLYCGLLEHDMAIIEAALAKHRDQMTADDFNQFFRPFLIREALARLRDESR